MDDLGRGSERRAGSDGSTGTSPSEEPSDPPSHPGDSSVASQRAPLATAVRERDGSDGAAAAALSVELPRSAPPDQWDSYARRDLSAGSVRRHVWRLAWPQWLESVLNIVDQAIDLFWAGRLPSGHLAIAGVGVAQTFGNLGMMARNGLDQGLRAMISRAVGAGDIGLANRIALQGLLLTVVYCTLLVAGGWVLSDILLRGIGASEAVRAETLLYMQITFVGTAGVAFRQVTAVTLQAAGDVLTPLKATTVTRVMGILITPLLMFGWLGLPEYGLAGAAIANVLAQAGGMAVNLVVLLRGSSRVQLSLRGVRVDLKIMAGILRIGLPASLSGMERSLSQILLLGIAASFGDVAVATYALTRRLEMLANFGGMGVGNAVGVMVGQNLGAQRPERARRAVGWGLLYVAGAKLLVGVPLFLFPAAFVLIFTAQPAVVELASTWFRILVVGALFLGFATVFQQTFNTAGDTITVMLVTLVTLVMVELPLAFGLTRVPSIGALGIAWAILIEMVVRAGIFVPIFFRGRWLKVKVL